MGGALGTWGQVTVSDRVQGVVTKQGRDITAIVNRSSLPRAFLGMAYGENSSLDEASWRDRRDLSRCDVSGNLTHISICTALDHDLVPGYTAQDGVTDRTVRAYHVVCLTETEFLLDAASTLFEAQCVAPANGCQQRMGLTDDQRDLLACCLWNAPNAPGAAADPVLAELAARQGWGSPVVRDYVANYWLTTGQGKYAVNRANYARGLKQADAHVVKEEPPMPEDTYVIGQGVKDAMAAHGDEPRSDEEYHGGTSGGGAQYSVTQGRDAQYRWTPADGVKVAPFD